MSRLPDDADEAPIDAAIERELVVGLIPIQLDSLSQSRVLHKILEQVRQELPKKFITVRNEDGEWREVSPHIYQKQLINDGRLHACLYRMAPGSTFPAHDHHSDEECVCLNGEVSLGGIILKTGEFHLAPQGLPHGEISTVTGCLLYIRCAGTEVSD